LKLVYAKIETRLRGVWRPSEGRPAALSSD